MKTNLTLVWRIVASCCAILAVSASAQAQVGMGPRQNSYTENFDGLPVSGKGTWKNGQQFLPGLAVYRSKSDTTITANNGQANTGGLYSYGNTGSTDRALGSLSSSTAGYFTYNLLLQNNTGNTIKSIDVNYTGEQWRISNNTAPQHVLSFWYAISSDPQGFNNAMKNDVGWTEVPELKFYGPKFYQAGGPLNGNAADNRAILQQILQIEVPAGYYLMLRWKDADELEADHGLAIDDVTVKWFFETVDMPAPLPVELAHFEGSVSGGQVLLQWQTASEDHNSYFEIERSTDGKVFESIGRVTGNGTTTQAMHYTFTDEEPLTGTAYYRLRQVDEDDSYTFSKVVSVTRKVEGQFSVYPTITSQELQVSSGLGLQQLRVTDLKGRKLLEVPFKAGALQLTVDVSRLSNGTYMLVLVDGQGKRHTSRFVKK